MKKIYAYILAAAGLFAAASCQEIVEPAVNAPEVSGETFSLTAVAGTDTKTTLVDGVKTHWTPGDELTVFDANGTNQKFVTAITEPAASAVFTTETFAMPDDMSNAVLLAVYPYVENAVTDFQTHVAGLEIPKTQQAVKDGFDSDASIAYALAMGEDADQRNLSFKNLYGLFKFTVEDEGVTKVTIRTNGAEVLSGTVTLLLNGTITAAGDNTHEVTLEGTFEKGGVYYVAAIPGTYNNGITVLYNDTEIKSTGKVVELKANTVLNLGSIGTPAVWGVCGTFTGNWNVSQNIHMTPTNNGWYVLEGVEMYKDDLFKFVTEDSWTGSLGYKDVVLTAEDAVEYALVADGQNLKVNKNGVFTISLNPAENKFKVECTEEYTDLTVNITVDNKAGWDPLYIYLESNGTAITAAEGDLVTDNVYAVSGDYIGSSLSYKFISGSKTSEPANVTITRNGAVVTLEETVIKLTFMLNTDNSKQWWGTTAKIHVWETGTSFDTSWPGNNMVYDGNYTWHINVPSELVGKTIKYLIHNGNGWQSSDSTVTITAEGVTVMGNEIGIN